MSLVAMSKVLIPARRGGYAVGAFEVWNLESVQAVVAAAEGLSQPVILQVGPYESDYAGLEDISLMALFQQDGQECRLHSTWITEILLKG